jgi:hypothetical protein
VGKTDKRLEGMRNNPRSDWKIEDVEALCGTYDIRFAKPNKSSHAKVSDATQEEILTIPFNRPIKPVYIKKPVKFVDAVLRQRAMAESGAALAAVVDALQRKAGSKEP